MHNYYVFLSNIGANLFQVCYLKCICIMLSPISEYGNQSINDISIEANVSNTVHEEKLIRPNQIWNYFHQINFKRSHFYLKILHLIFPNFCTKLTCPALKKICVLPKRYLSSSTSHFFTIVWHVFLISFITISLFLHNKRYRE